MSEGDFAGRHRPTSVFVLGVLHIVFGPLYFLLTACTGLLVLAGFDRMMARNPGVGMARYAEQQHPTLMAVGRWMNLINLAVAVLLIVAGVGLLRMRPWARRASFVYAAAHAALLVYSAVVTTLVLYPAMEEYLRQKAAHDPQQGITSAMMPAMRVSTVFTALLMLAYPVTVVALLLRRPVREAFAAPEGPAAFPDLSGAPPAWDDGTPGGRSRTGRLPRDGIDPADGGAVQGLPHGGPPRPAGPDAPGAGAPCRAACRKGHRMSPRTLAPALGLALAWAAVGGTARADPVPWAYAWDVTADPGSGGLPCDLTTTRGAGVGPQVTAAAFRYFRGIPAFAERPVTLTLSLTDFPSGATGRLTFHGGLASPTGYGFRFHVTGPWRESLVLGEDRYTVSLSGDPPPGIGFIPEYVFVGWAQTDTARMHAPEPSALALALLGLPAAAWGRRRSGRH